eukprot:COSAG02_NODE_8036_length_2738_cov_6.194013_1_plen_47_part_00
MVTKHQKCVYTKSLKKTNVAGFYEWKNLSSENSEGGLDSLGVRNAH